MTPPPSVLHVIVTRNFAGAERYVCDVATATAGRGWRVAVVGGAPDRMRVELGADVAWQPGGTVREAISSVSRLGWFDVCHLHMTLAEAVGVWTRRRHRGRLVSTRHFAGHRGSTAAGRALAPWIQRRLDCQIAISDFVNTRLEQPADVVIRNGTAGSDLLWSPSSRRVLVLQRLEAEKDTGLALRAWRISGLAQHGWTLRVVGSGAQREALQNLVTLLNLEGVEFAGHTNDVPAEFRAAGIVLAPAPAEPLGLSVIEAMSAGVPVVAAGAGGHLETVGAISGTPLFAPGDPDEAGALLAKLADDVEWRVELSGAYRRHQADELSIDSHLDALLATYRPAAQPPTTRA